MVMLQVMEFAIAIQEEEDAEVHGGLLKAPKVLADIVESVAAAVYVDCNFNLKDMWLVSFSFAWLFFFNVSMQLLYVICGNIWPKWFVLHHVQFGYSSW